MTIYYVDPLNGSSANNGLTSADNAVGNTGPFGSYNDCFTGSIVGGITNGDIVYLVASTMDYIPYQSLPTQTLSNIDFGTTGGIAQIRAVNPTTLEEDGTKYTFTGNDQQYVARFANKQHFGFVYHNCRIIGYWHNYSSGGSSVYVNCEFTDAYGGITFSSNTLSFYLDNCNMMFRNCKMYKAGTGNYTHFSQRDGSIYSGGGSQYESCEFYGFNLGAALGLQRDSSFYDCRFKDCEHAIEFELRSNGGDHQVYNCIIDNMASNAFEQDEQNSTLVNWPKRTKFYGNLLNDIGGYVYYYREPTATEIDFYIPADAGGLGQREADGWLDWEGNVYQNATSGVHSLPFNSEMLARGWHSVQGNTAATFGLTHDNGFGLMLATGDHTTFNYFVGTSAGMGTFLKDFTEAIVSGSVPEFGDVF
jgi:hypothetical protein